MQPRYLKPIALILAVLLPAAAYAQLADSLRHIYYSVTPAGNYLIVNQRLYSTIFNKEGKPLFPFRYTQITPGLNGNFIADRCKIIDAAGNETATLSGNVVYCDQEHGYYKTESNGAYALYDAGGNQLVAPLDSPTFNNGMVPYYDVVTSYYKRGVMDTTGKVMLPAVYQSVSTGSGLMAALRDDTAFIYNSKGKLLFATRADECKVMKGDVPAIRLYGLWALVDSMGNLLTPFKYHTIEEFGIPGLLKVNGRLLNNKGREVLWETDNSLYPIKGGWIQNGFQDPEILDDQLRVVIGKGSYSHLHDATTRFLLLRRYYDDPDPVAYDRTLRKKVPFAVEEELAGGAYVIRDKTSGKRSVLKGKGIVPLPSFTKIETANRYGSQGFYKIILAQHTGQYIKNIFSSDETEITADLQGLLDSQMNLVVPIKYSSIDVHPASQCLIARAGNRTTVYNTQGKVYVTIPGSAEAQETGQLTRLQYNDSTWLIGPRGIVYRGIGVVSILTARTAMHAWNEYNGDADLLAITDSTGNAGIYDLAGRLRQPHAYRVLSGKTEGLATLKKNDSLYFMNYRGRLVFGGRGFSGRNCTVLKGYAVLLQDTAGHWGVTGASGATTVPFIYDTMYQDPRTLNYMLGRNGIFEELENTGYLATARHTTASAMPPGDVPAAAVAKYGLPIVRLQQETDNARPGIYNRRGKYLSGSYKDFRYAIFPYGVIITDSALKQFSVIDTEGATLLPYTDIRDRLIVNDYTLTTLSAKSADTLYTFDGRSFTGRAVRVDSAQKAGILNTNQFTKLQPQRGLRFRSGRAAGVIPTHRDAIWIDQADSVYDIGYATAIQQRGKWQLYERYTAITPSSELLDSLKLIANVVYTYANGKQGVYTPSTPVRLPAMYDTVYNAPVAQGLFVVRQNGKDKMVSKQGFGLSAAYDSIDRNVGWLYRLPAYRNGSKYYLSIAKDGKITEERAKDSLTLHQDITGFSDRLAVVQEGTKYGLYDNRTHRWLLHIRYDEIRVDFGTYTAHLYGHRDSTIVITGDGTVLFRLTGRKEPTQLLPGFWTMGNYHTPPVVNRNGKVVIPDTYQEVEVSGDHFIVTRRNADERNVGICDTNGKILTPATMDVIAPASWGYSIGFVRHAGNDEADAYLLGPHGHQLTKQPYQLIQPNAFYNAPAEKPFFFAAKGGKWGILNEQGKVMLPLAYDSIQQFYQGKLAVVKDKRSGKWGMVDGHGKVVAPFRYHSIGIITFDAAAFRRDDAEGMLDVKGKESYGKKAGQ